MTRVLLTGMSGVGKSSVLRALSAMGHRAVDVDEQGWLRRAPDGGWVWKEEMIERVLDEETGDGILFLGGCAESQVRFYPRFDAIVLLSAPKEVMLERIDARTDNRYGKAPEERREILRNLRAVEPLLRRSATHEVDTTRPLPEVVDEVLRIARLAGQAGSPAGK